MPTNQEQIMSQNLDLKRFATDAGVNLIRVTLMTLFGVGISIALARGLGTEGKGFYEVAIFIPNLLYALVSIGTYPATIYHVANTRYDPLTSARGNLTISFWLSVIGLTIGIAVIFLFHNILFPNVPQYLLYISLGLLPFLHSRQNLSGIFQGKQDFRTFSMVELLPYIVNFVLLASFIWWIPDREGVAIVAIICGNFAAVCFALYRLREYTNSKNLFTLTIDRSYFRDTLGYGLKTQLGLIMLFFLFRFDVFLINQIGTGAEAVGIYSIAVVLAERVWVFSGFVSQVMLPRIASWKDENEKRTQLTIITMRFTFWLSILISLLIILFGRILIELLYGAAFSPSVNALLLILPGIVMYNFSRVLGTDMSGRGKPEVNSILFTLSLGVNIVANLILIPRFDFIGAAIASSVSYSVLGIMTSVIFCRMYGIRWQELVFFSSTDWQRITQLLSLIRLKLIAR
jgi:O-antigen/teichoic acid export membrane protein